MDNNDKKPNYSQTVEKEKQIYVNEVDRKYEDMLQRQEEENRALSIDLGVRDVNRIAQIQKSNEEYLSMAKNSDVFINNDFKGKIPYFARNLILIAGTTGDGKSTTCANLSAHALKQGQRVLVITNEENVSDVYNRVTCLVHGWSYANHENFSSEQISIFTKYIDLLSHRLTVVDDGFMDSVGQTTTLEGVTSIFNSIKAKNNKFDVIIIDYYQNIDTSITVPSLKDWEVQSRIVKFLDKFKNSYDAPIIVLAQKKQNSDTMSFKESIEGRKIILNIATCALEMKADRDNRRTAWTIKKSRFPESVGDVIYTGYEKGLYVPYTKEFQNKVLAYKEAQAHNEVVKNINPTNFNQGGNDGGKED